ncbi:MAG: lipopolysaccharide biosynthesis protein [Clostridia bacterium]|nr:lipopolysaccharide biosynthesis protein [Clostridia bacterium]
MINAVNQRRAGAALSYVYIIVNSLIILVYQPLVLRFLGQSEYGLYQLMSSVINYLNIMDLGFGNGIVVYTAKYHASGRYEEEKKLHGMFFLIFCCIGMIAFGAGCAVTLNAEKIFLALTPAEIAKSKILLAILSVNMGLTFVLSIYGNIIIAYERFVFSKILNIVRVALNPLIMIPLLCMGADSVVLVAVISAINIGCLLTNVVFCKKKLGLTVRYCGFEKPIFIEILSYSIFVFIAEIVDKINWYVDQSILGIVKGTREVTVYSMASNYNQMALQLSAVFSSVMLPKVTKMVATDADDKALSGEFIKTSRLQYMTIFLFVSGFVMLGHKFVVWHVGIECEMSYYIALLLILASAIPITQSVGISIMKAKNLFRVRALITLGMAFVNIAISIPLAIKLGGIGSAAGTAFSLIVANVIIMNIYYHKRCGINMAEYWKTVAVMTLKFLPAVAVTAVLKFTLKLPGMTEFFVLGTVYVLLYCITAYFAVMNEYEKGIVKKAVGKVLRRSK